MISPHFFASLGLIILNLSLLTILLPNVSPSMKSIKKPFPILLLFITLIILGTGTL